MTLHAVQLCQFLRQQSVRAFEQILDGDEPEVMCIGVPRMGSLDTNEPMVDVDVTSWLSASDFRGFSDRAQSRMALSQEFRLITDLDPEERLERMKQLFRKAARDELEDLLNSHPNNSSSRYFLSEPMELGKHLVFIVLGLSNSMVGKVYECGSNLFPVGPGSLIAIQAPASFLIAQIWRFLDYASRVAVDTGPPHGIDVGEHLRGAAKRFLSAVCMRITADVTKRTVDLFDIFNNISSLQYEHNIGHGTFLLGKETHPRLERQLTFESPFKITEFRHVRKLLELTGDNLMLHTDMVHVFGLVHVMPELIAENRNLFQVSIVGHHHWQLRHCGVAMVDVRYGQPAFPKTALDEPRLAKNLRRVFRSIPLNVERIVALVRESQYVKHGTTLVFSPHAAEEAKRLTSQSIEVKPFDLQPGMIGRLASIDGAILVSPDCQCHAIGVILDGPALKEGDPGAPAVDRGRGSRYNSAVKYRAWRGDPILIVVVSADGGIDFVPDFPKPLQKAKIQEKLRMLSQLCAEPAHNFERILDVTGWFKKHCFYLNRETCTLINEVFSTLRQRQGAFSPPRPTVIAPEFSPSPDLEEHYDLE